MKVSRVGTGYLRRWLRADLRKSSPSFRAFVLRALDGHEDRPIPQVLGARKVFDTIGTARKEDLAPLIGDQNRRSAQADHSPRVREYLRMHYESYGDRRLRLLEGVPITTTSSRAPHSASSCTPAACRSR